MLSESHLVDTSVSEDEDTEAIYQLKSNKSDDKGEHLKCACPVIADSLALHVTCNSSSLWSLSPLYIRIFLYWL